VHKRIKEFILRVIKLTGKPFKSGRKINTVKSDNFIHPVTGKPCYHFDEDNTYVEIHRCRQVTSKDETDDFMYQLSKGSHLKWDEPICTNNSDEAL
jgi:hypothetical protein